MSYQKTEWVEYETLVSAFNLNKIENQLQRVSLSTELNEMAIKSTDTQVKKLSTSTESALQKAEEASTQIGVISNEVTSTKDKVSAFENEKNLSIFKSNKDSEGIFTKVTYRRKADNTVYCVSTLSGGTSPLYSTRTEQYYDVTGTNVINKVTYTLFYDGDGNLVSEV